MNQRILMILIGSMGDCLIGTAIARQIKEVDYPGCHLTWMIGDRFKDVLKNNVHVDEVIEVPLSYTNESISKMLNQAGSLVKEQEDKGKSFDKIFHFSLTEKEGRRYAINYGSIRSGHFRTYHEVYGHKVTGSPDPVINLTKEEVGNVTKFIKKYKLDEKGVYPIIFESNPKSKQSNMTFKRATSLANRLTRKYPNVRCILSAKEPFESKNPHIIDGSALSYRENAELINHCKLFVGSNSGITWLNTSTWSKKIPMIQDVIGDDATTLSISFSVELDFKILGLPTENLIEIKNTDENRLYDCICTAIDKGFSVAKYKYPESKELVSEALYRLQKRLHSERDQTKVYLFDVIPLLKTSKNRQITRIKLFGFIPLIKIKPKEN